MLPISDKYRLTSDAYQWIVQEKRPNGDWRPIMYYPDLESTITGLSRHMMRISPAEGWEEATAATWEIHDTLRDALKAWQNAARGGVSDVTDLDVVLQRVAS